MAVKTESSPFGSTTRTRALLALHLLSESYPRELARVLEAPLSTVQKALVSLERDRLVAARAMGRTRIYRIDSSHFAYRDLQRYLARLGEPERRLKGRIAALRRRPRRTSKPLWR